MGKQKRRLVRSKLVTVASLLARDDVGLVLEEFMKSILPDVTGLVIGYKLADGSIGYAQAALSDIEVLGVLRVIENLILDEE